jgi:hypothetical protein
VYLAIALTTGGTLLLELSLTRIFSVVFYYHLAFLFVHRRGMEDAAVHQTRSAQRDQQPAGGSGPDRHSQPER